MALTAYISITSVLVGTFGEVAVCPEGSCQALEPWTETCFQYNQASKAAAGGTAYVAFWECAHGMPLALRMAPISPKEWPAGEEYFYQSQSLQSLLQTFQKALSLEEEWVYASLRYGLQAIPRAMRRFTKDIEIKSEVLFRQSASLTKLMFMVVPVAAECELCVPHSSSLEVWKRQERTQLAGVLRIRVSVFQEFTPLEITYLTRAETVLFIWGFLSDIAIMARMGLWFDCHMGNIVWQLDQYGEKTFAWLDFGGRTGGDMFFRQLADTLIAGMNRLSDLGANATAKSLSELVHSFSAHPGLDQVAERAQEILIETSPDYEFASHVLQRVGPLRPDRLRSLQERRPRAGSLRSSVWVRELIRKDGTITEKLRRKEDGKEFEPVNAFQVKGALANVDDLKEGIKNKAELSIPSFKIDIYSREDKDWVKEDTMSARLRDTTEADCYGFVLPQADDV